MSVHRICEFDPFWTNFFFFSERHSLRQTDGNMHRQRRSNSSLDIWGTKKYETPCRGNEAIFAVVEKSCFAASQYNEVHFLAMMAILG